MEYISAEEFLNQELGVQRIFKEYFDGDSMLFWNHEQLVYWRFEDISINIPAITEGQLRKFIEDKTNTIVETYLTIYKEYNITLVHVESEEFSHYETKSGNLLQAYWKVACEIAKEGI